MNLTTSRDHALRLAVWSVIVTEAVMFTALLVMHGGPDAFPSFAALALAVAITAALFAGGGALASALRWVRAGRSEVAFRLLALGTGLGFLALALELAGARLFAMPDHLGLAIVGLHAAHVSAAIALAAWVLALVHGWRVHRRHHGMLDLVATYWYFVSAVWVFVWPLFTGSRP